jgi:hypothetical protein
MIKKYVKNCFTRCQCFAIFALAERRGRETDTSTEDRMRVHHIYIVIKSEEKMNLLLLLWLFVICYEACRKKKLKTIYVNFVVLKSEEKF